MIAAVILIAATMTIAGILSFWTTSFIKSRLGEAENVTEGSVCPGADFEFQTGRYDGNTQTLYFILDNTRSVDLEIENLYLFYDDKMVPKRIGGTLKANEIKEFNVTVEDLNFNRATIKTNCPEVTLGFTPQVIG